MYANFGVEWEREASLFLSIRYMLQFGRNENSITQENDRIKLSFYDMLSWKSRSSATLVKRRTLCSSTVDIRHAIRVNIEMTHSQKNV